MIKIGLARFGEPGVLVLLSLSDGPKHGYAITEDVLQQTGIRSGRELSTARSPSWSSAASFPRSRARIAVARMRSRQRGERHCRPSLPAGARIVEAGKVRLQWG